MCRTISPECATDALRVAAKLSRLSGAMLHLVHVYEDMTDHPAITGSGRHRAAAGQVPELPFLAGIPMKRFMLRQFGITEMFRNTQLRSMDMIVMGSNGARGLGGMVGSNTQRVRVAPMPILGDQAQRGGL